MSRRPPVPRRRAALAGVLAVIVVVVGAAIVTRGGGGTTETFELQALLDAVADGRVATATLHDREGRVTGELTGGGTYESRYPERYVPELTDALVDADIAVTVDNEGAAWWEELLYELFPVLVMVGALLYFLVAMQGGGLRGQLGKTRARRRRNGEPSVSFADVAGADEAIEELREIRDFLADPDRFTAIGARIPKGVLLYGPPGTGKTLLARAVAGEAGAPFFSISGSDFVEMFVGVGASRVRDLFQQAKAAAPSIVFVDEIDAVGRHRGAGVGGGHDEREQTLNQLLVEMDGFDTASGVILVAATNRPDILDPALLRPGRFDRQIVVDRPDLVGRRAILDVHARGKPLADDVDLDVVARRTPGFTGADLANTLNEAALLAARRGRTTVGAAELDDAVERVLAGPERRSRVLSEREKRVVAYHEAGHALVGHVLPNCDPIHKVSIIARGRALGWTLALPTEDRTLRTRSELRDELAMLMGGRTAEELIFGDPTTGAQNDLERATEQARAMVTQFGMSEAVGPQQLGHRGGGDVFVGRDGQVQRVHSDELAAVVDAEVRRLLDDAHAEAREILHLHRAVLDRLADALVEHETLHEDQLLAIFGLLETGAPSRLTAVDPAAPRS
jgi:cell division protease FtsH